MSKETVTLYAYIKPINKKHLLKMSLDTNQPISTCLDAIIDATRLKRDIKIPEKKLTAIERLRRIKDKKKLEIKKLDECK